MSCPMADYPLTHIEIQQRTATLKPINFAGGGGGTARFAHDGRNSLSIPGCSADGGHPFSIQATHWKCPNVRHKKDKTKKKKGFHAWVGFLMSCLLCKPVSLRDVANVQREVICIEPYFSIPVTPAPTVLPC